MGKGSTGRMTRLDEGGQCGGHSHEESTTRPEPERGRDGVREAGSVELEGKTMQLFLVIFELKFSISFH